MQCPKLASDGHSYVAEHIGGGPFGLNVFVHDIVDSDGEQSFALAVSSMDSTGTLNIMLCALAILKKTHPPYSSYQRGARAKLSDGKLSKSSD